METISGGNATLIFSIVAIGSPGRKNSYHRIPSFAFYASRSWNVKKKSANMTAESALATSQMGFQA